MCDLIVPCEAGEGDHAKHGGGGGRSPLTRGHRALYPAHDGPGTGWLFGEPPQTAFVSGPAARLQGGRSDLRRLCATAHLAGLDEAGLDQFEALLTAPDQEVYAWLRGAAPVPAEYDKPVFAGLKALCAPQEPDMERLDYIARARRPLHRHRRAAAAMTPISRRKRRGGAAAWCCSSRPTMCRREAVADGDALLRAGC